MKESKMRRFRNPAKNTYGFLSVALGAAVTGFVALTGVFVFSLIQGVPLPSPDAFPVNIMINNHYLANEAKDIYLCDLSGHLLFFKPSIGLQLCSGTFTIFISGCLAFVIYLLRKIVGTTVKGDPFVKENGRRLRIIGIMFIIVPLVLQAWQKYLVSSVISSVRIENVSLTTGSVTGSIIGILPISLTAGLFFLALSEVFRIGASLKEENEMTV